jgi:hypothetical protein
MVTRFVLLALALLCLSGCMEGSKPESDRLRRDDAKGTRQVNKEARS